MARIHGYVKVQVLIPLGFAAAAFLFWELRVIGSATLREGFPQTDFYTFMFPMYRYGFGELAAGRIPLWNPFTYTGIPFLATLQPGLLYPGNFFFFLLPTGQAMGATVALHIFLTAWFMFLLGRAWGWSRTAACVAGLAWAFSQNGVWFYGGAICFLQSAAWIPLMALGIERACGGRKISGAAILGLSGAMSLLAGGLQTFVYGAYALAFIGAVRLWRVARERGARQGVAVAGWLILGAITAGALAAPQLLPTYELSMHTERRPGGLPLAWTGSFIPPGYAPDAEGAPPSPLRAHLEKGARGVAALWTLTPRELPLLYFGILPPLLAIAALFGPRRKLALAAAAGAGVALVLSMGLRTPLYEIYHGLPTGAWFRNTGRFALLISLAMASLAGMGVVSLEGGGAPRRRGLGAALLAAAGGLVLVALGGSSVGALWRTGGVAMAGLALLAAASSQQTSRMRATARVAIVLLLFTELFFAYRNPYYHPQLDAEVLDDHAGVTAYLRTHAEGGRVVVVDNAWESWAVQRRYGLLQRVRTLNDFEPLTPATYRKVFRLLDQSRAGLAIPFDGQLRLDPARVNKRVLDMLGVRFVLVDRGLAATWGTDKSPLGLARVPLDDPEVSLFENPGALPRATLVPGAAVVGTEWEAVRVISDPAFDPRLIVAVHGDVAGAIPPGSAGPVSFPKMTWKGKRASARGGAEGAVRIVRDEPERVEIEATVPDGRGLWLVLMDLNFPGWKATVDGRPASILTANLAGRAVPLSPGTHRVVFHYEARMFRLGCWIALGAAVAWGAGFLFRRAPRGSGGASRSRELEHAR